MTSLTPTDPEKALSLKEGPRDEKTSSTPTSASGLVEGEHLRRALSSRQVSMIAIVRSFSSFTCITADATISFAPGRDDWYVRLPVIASTMLKLPLTALLAGTGLFLGTGRSLATGGPGSLLINYSIVGAVVLLVMLCLG
jgi:amino acid permease